jgi:hypothetical protein
MRDCVFLFIIIILFFKLNHRNLLRTEILVRRYGIAGEGRFLVLDITVSGQVQLFQTHHRGRQ